MSTTTASRPPIALVVCSVLVIAGCLFVVGIAVAACTVTWDPCSVISGVILFPLPTALAVQQYRGTFRRNARAAAVSSVLLFVIGAFGLFAFVTTLGEMVADGVESIPDPELWIALLLPMLATVAVTGWGGWANRRWSRQLKMVVPAEQNARGRMRFSLREVLGAVAAVALVAGTASYFVRATLPQYAEHVSSDRAPAGVPPDAHDICFAQGSRGLIAYEFSIDEAGFTAWAEKKFDMSDSAAPDFGVREITDPFTMQRYRSFVPGANGTGPITITNGLYCVWQKGDCGKYAAFDRTTGRAYYFARFN